MAEEFPNLARAPITEALLDIRVQVAADVSPETLATAFRERVTAAFPEDGPIRQVQVALGDAVAGGATSGQQIIGSIFWSATRKRAVQARVDGFSVNHVGEYRNWDAIIDDAKRYWADYVAVAHPIRVVRCAARFINRIDVPVGEDLGRHLQTRPEVGEQLPPMNEYFMRAVISFAERRHAVITEATMRPADGGAPDKRSILLDIDAFSDTDLATDGDGLWDEFEELRIVKNRCFFQSLQRRTWEAYK